MFRNLIAIITIVIISFVLLVTPVHAEYISLNIFDKGNHSEIDYNGFLNNLDIFD